MAAESNYEALDLAAVQEQVAEEATFAAAKTYLLHETVDFNPLVINDKVRKVREAWQLIEKEGRYSFNDLNDIRPLLKRLKQGFTLTALELAAVCEHNLSVKRIIRHFRDNCALTTLSDYLDSLYYSQELIEDLQKAIGSDGEIKNTASNQLFVLNRELQAAEAAINAQARLFSQKNSACLQENVIYSRNNRTCFLVKNSFKNQFAGYNYGNSASGLAAYIEPQCLIEANNRRISLLNEIENEIKAILLALSLQVLKEADYFRYNLESLTLLDAYFAKAAYGLANNGVLAKLGAENLLLADIAHPLIAPKTVVRNTYHLTQVQKVIIISGSNTGGKTVSLKLIGLSVLMAYLGIPLAAQAAQIPFYDALYVDINANQSIKESLSSFSSRLIALNDILEHATAASLVLIDEIATGTDPKEGEALALAIITCLHQKAVSLVVTTHFSALKKYALEHEDILLAAQLFDTAQMKPTFRYLENSLGSSNALEIAAHYLVNQDVLTAARNILKDNTAAEEKLALALETEKREVKRLKEELTAELKEAQEAKARLSAAEKAYAAQEKERQQALSVRLQAYYAEQKKKADAIIHELQTRELKSHEALHLKKKLNAFDQVESVVGLTPVLKLNDNVRILKTGQVGKIISLNKERAIVAVNGIGMNAALTELEPVKALKVSKPVYRKREFKRVAREIVLVGLHIDEALTALAQYLDKAYGADLSQVKIITGIGSGALRSAVWDYLKKEKNIAEYHYADGYEGGSAATIAIFKKEK